MHRLSRFFSVQNCTDYSAFFRCGNMYEVPTMTWAIFPCTIDTIGKTEAQVITKWLPKYKYKPLNKGYITGKMKSNAPDIEHYKEDGSVEVWIAIQD